MLEMWICRLALSLLIILNQSEALAETPPPPTECFGPADAKVSAIYLHGRDTRSATLASENRRRIKALANKMGIRIAAPLAPNACPNRPDKLCWDTFSDAKTVAQNLNHARKLSTNCIPLTSNPHLIGFSSGGWLANKILTHCLNTPFSSITTIGASGSLGNNRELKDCPSIRMILGDQEEDRPKAERFLKAALAHNANITLDLFNGVHEVPSQKLEEILTEQVLKSQLQECQRAVREGTNPSRECRISRGTPSR